MERNKRVWAFISCPLFQTRVKVERALYAAEIIID
jgi:hypothetical protein